MKTPKWEEGLHGSIGNYPPGNGKMLTPFDKVTTNMTVTAKCKKETIRLRILQEVETEVFRASIMGDYFLNELEELNDGDEVIIDRKHILWLHGEE